MMNGGIEAGSSSSWRHFENDSIGRCLGLLENTSHLYYFIPSALENRT